MKVLWLDQGHSDGLFYQHPPSGNVRGVTLLSATDGLSSYAQSLLPVHINTHIHTQSSTKVQNHANTSTLTRSVLHTHTITSLLSLRERGFQTEVCASHEAGRRGTLKTDRAIRKMKIVNLSNISRVTQTVREFFFYLL